MSSELKEAVRVARRHIEHLEQKDINDACKPFRLPGRPYSDHYDEIKAIKLLIEKIEEDKRI